jgi:hypothetical protein
MTKMYAINAIYVPGPEDGWESSGIQLPTFYLHPNTQMILGEGGAQVIARSIFEPLLKRGGATGTVNAHATEVEV